MVVREAEYRPVLEVLNQFHSVLGVRLAFSVVQIPDSEDWGTADSLRSLRSKIRVSFCVKVVRSEFWKSGMEIPVLLHVWDSIVGKMMLAFMGKSLIYLRPVPQHQHSDILVVSCDLVTTVPLRRLTEFHSCHHSTLTCLLTHPPTPQDDAQRKTHAPAGEGPQNLMECNEHT